MANWFYLLGSVCFAAGTIINSPYPIHPNGDPMVLGEPCGFIDGPIINSMNGRPEKTDDEVIAAILRSRPA